MRIKRIKAWFLAVVLSVSGLFYGCDFGVADIPTGLIFPDMQEGQNIVSYLSSKLLNQYRDTIVTMLTDGIKSALNDGTLDGFINDALDSQYDTVMNKLFVENREKMIAELKTILIGDGTAGTQTLLDDPAIVDEIVDTIMGNDSFKDEIVKELMDTGNPDSLINELSGDPDFAEALVSNPAFMESLMGNAYFNDYMEWVVARQLYEKLGVVSGFPDPGNPPDPKDPKYN